MTAIGVLSTRSGAARAQHVHEPSATEPPSPEHHHDPEPASHEHRQDAEPVDDVPLATRELARLAAGTAWQPENTPHAGLHLQAGDWRLMFHGLFFLAYDRQGGTRGDGAALAAGWVMGMAERDLGPGRFAARAMLSPEPLTVPPGGYPLLLQTGETYKGQPLHDRQHPHDLFMEIGALYALPLTPDVALEFYAAPAGEPALGPPGFPHRVSSTSDPLAPLGHHWQDSTHITFGVLTAAVVTRHLKLEGSWFNGREPDEKRADIEFRAPDSYAVRLAASLPPTLVAQISFGHLASPESLEPDESVSRATASVTHVHPFASGGRWATTAGWGMNRGHHGITAHSALVETDIDIDGHSVVFGRAEYVRKVGGELQLLGPSASAIFDLGSVSAGYLYNLGPFGPLRPGLGFRATVNVLPDDLRPFYGSRTPYGLVVYLRLATAPSGEHQH